MRPAYSIILFTTLSGLGYGLLALLGLSAAIGLVPPGRWLGLFGLGIALGLIAAGLLSSTLHLGHPERAWRALSQWRSSWLSREGVLALATFAPAGAFAVGWVYFGSLSGAWALCGVLAAVGAVLTVYCTSMIYASIRAVPRWHTVWVPLNYLSLALMNGALSFAALMAAFGLESPAASVLAAAAVALAWALKAAYWRATDFEPPASSAATATGLGAFGTVRLLDPPHTEENYLQHEMGFRIARKHASKLRRIAILCAFVLPLALSLAALAVAGALAAILAMAAALLALFGTLVERWLFFAEAKHTVSLYYGGDSA